MTKKFTRRDFKRYSKLGKRRKKLQKWRKPKGRDNKMREKRYGYPKVVSVGYKSPRKSSGKIEGLNPVLICNTKDLEKMNKKSVVIIGRVGAKKKIEIIKKSVEMKLKILNLGGEVKKG